MTPTRNEILETLGVGFLLATAGAVWLWGGMALLISGAVLILVGILMGFLPYQGKKKG